ncbi:hypothetical protein [Pedobacter ginsengisoli]|uniref:hypothetical protein n=1 Tax=Pedobacter ginsengisoli TaxID=363852 RepID=UPI00254FA605|nr:hypothetical protein [Pedobacter ginsengisoli]
MEVLYMEVKALQGMLQICPSTAKKKIAKVRKALGIPKYEKVTVEEYCKEHRLNYDTVQKLLQEGMKRK